MNTFSRKAQFILLGALLVAAAFALAGHPIIPHDMLAGIGMVGFAGELTIIDVAKKVDDIGVAWKAYTDTNDAIIKAKADGKAVGDMEVKLEKIGKDLDKLLEAKAAMEETLVKLSRSGLGAADEKSAADLKLEVKQFNLERRSFAQGGSVMADIDADAYKAYKAAYWQIFRKGSIDALSSDERKALQAGADSDGGYLMPTPTIGRVVQKVFELSPMRQICAQQTISTEALEGLEDNDEASFGWVAEQGARAETNTPQVGKYRIEAFEMYASPKATQKLLDDAAVDVEAWLAAKVANKFARAEAAAFITGTGAGQPRGWTTESVAATGDATRPWGTLEIKNTGVNSDFAVASPGDILFDLIGAFKQAYLQNAKWLTRREVIAKIRKFKEATTNAYMWQPGLQAGQPDKLLGYPISIAQDMPALAAGSISLGFGDWTEGYQIVDRIGIRTLRDPYTQKPFVIFYSTKRTGGRVLNFEAIKAIQFS